MSPVILGIPLEKVASKLGTILEQSLHVLRPGRRTDFLVVVKAGAEVKWTTSLRDSELRELVKAIELKLRGDA